MRSTRRRSRTSRSCARWWAVIPNSRPNNKEESVSRQLKIGGLRYTRRETLETWLACAGAAAFGIHTGRAQGVTAPVGDGAPLAELGMDLSAEQRAAGAAFLKRHASVDTHSHPGRFFLKQLADQTPTTRAFGEAFEERAIAGLAVGNVSATLFCAVADMRLLEMTATQGLRAARDWSPGEAYADYRRQMAQLKALLANHALSRGL